MRWLWATFTKSRSWPLGSGIVLCGTGIGFQFRIGLRVLAAPLSRVENPRNGILVIAFPIAKIACNRKPNSSNQRMKFEKTELGTDLTG